MLKRKHIYAIAWAAAMVIGIPSALAQTSKTSISNADRNTELNKHVGFIDLYVTAAINDAKFMSTLADAAPGPSDKGIVAEARKDLDQAIDRSLGHLTKLRTFKRELSMAAGGGGATDASADSQRQDVSGDATAGSDRLGKLDILERHLKEAKAATKKLAGVQMADLSTAIDGVATQLMGADTAFRAVAKWTNYTRLQNTNLSTVPVRGDDVPAGPVERDIDKDRMLPPASPALPDKPPALPDRPGANGTVPPGKTPSATPPSINEPVQPAPGTGSPATPPGGDGVGK
jgi:hypothetical protein